MRIFWEHFDGRNNNQTNSKWVFFDVECTIQNTVNFGTANGYCCTPRYVAGARVIIANDFPPFSEGFFGVHFRTTSATSTASWTSFYTGGGSTDLNFSFNASGQMVVKRDVTAIATGTFVFAPNDNYHIQIHMVISDTVGVIQTKVNGVLDIDASGLDTRHSGTTITAFEFRNQGSGTQFYVDNIVLHDTTNTDGLGDTSWPGILNCFVQVPTGNGTGGTDDEWQKSTGASAAALTDDTPANDDTDYIYENTVGEKQRVTFPSTGLSGSGVAIESVDFEHIVRNVSSGGCKLGTKEGGTTTMEASARTLLISYETEEIRYKNNPRTAAPYTVSEALGSDAVIEMTA